ncbi:hypothetical protein BWQ96_04419 [Gracilariopsis chorda]|uniref:F-box domain-containing protein n=1 Tax=Gracilariopsis chorda TaxID=448386 RepID=A0A2V3IVS1_9FLOR|nr:hypothetical protein BWQ96_04419 [Gracilariopsis chorda]|eukprot:PXF45807.1 hypothetical protein BWQ96_04419 [Gracilariopsis chorda]
MTTPAPTSLVLDALPEDVQLRIAEMLAARAPCTDMTPASLALAQSSPTQCHTISRALDHSLTLRFETDAAAWAQLLLPTLRSLHILTFGSPLNHAAFRRLLSAPNLQHARIPCARHLLSALHAAPKLRSLFLTSYTPRNNAALLGLLPTLPSLRSLRIDSCALTLLLPRRRAQPPAADSHLLWRIAQRVPQLVHLDIFVHFIHASRLASTLMNFPCLTSLTLRTNCDAYPLFPDLHPVFEALDELCLHGFYSALIPVIPTSPRARDLCALIATKLVHISECTMVAMQFPKLRVLDTVVRARHRLVLPASLTDVTLRWEPIPVPKPLVPALSPSLTQRLGELQHVRHLALHNVLVTNENLHSLLSAIGGQLHSLTVPVILQLCAPADRLYDVFEICARYCAQLRELQVSEMRCTNFSSWGPAASAQPVHSFSWGLAEESVQRLQRALGRLCTRAPLLDERPMKAVICMMQSDMRQFERCATGGLMFYTV